MNDLHKSSFCLCFMNEAHRVKVIVHSLAKCGFDPVSIALIDFVSLSVNQALVGGITVNGVCQ